MANEFNAVDNSSILYQNTDELLNQAILTPFSEQKFDLLGSKTDDTFFHHDSYNTLGIYDQYNESGPSSVHFGDGIEPSEHGGSHLNGNNGVLNGHVRPGELHAVSSIAGDQLPISPSHEAASHDAQLNGSHNAISKLDVQRAGGAQTPRAVAIASSKIHDAPLLDSIIVGG
jgi:lysine-specific histone demethylase 1